MPWPRSMPTSTSTNGAGKWVSGQGLGAGGEHSTQPNPSGLLGTNSHLNQFKALHLILPGGAAGSWNSPGTALVLSMPLWARPEGCRSRVAWGG